MERQEWMDNIQKCIDSTNGTVAKNSPPNTSTAAGDNTNKSTVTKTTETDEYKDCERVIVLFDYDAKEANELTVKANDVIIVIKKYPNSEWIKGKFGDKIGLLPGNFTR